jgi:hypothetical protein
MLYLQRAALLPRALGQFAPLLSVQVVTIVLLLVASVAEVGVAPAEPLRYVAAELALELYVVGAVLLAVLDPAGDLEGGTLGTDEVLFLVFFVRFLFFLILHALLHAAEVGQFALETFKEGNFLNAEVLESIIVVIGFVLEAFVLVEALVATAFDGFLFQVNLVGIHPFHEGMYLGTGRGLDLLLAGGAIHEVEGNAGACPFSAQDVHHALKMENVVAVEFHTGALPKPIDSADIAVGFVVLPKGSVRVLLDTFLIHAW